jgi:hypothetical protein
LFPRDFLRAWWLLLLLLWGIWLLLLLLLLLLWGIWLLLQHAEWPFGLKKNRIEMCPTNQQPGNLTNQKSPFLVD